MDKFIFVCYEHGTGGEGLAVEISKLHFCNDLKYEKHGDRTWSYDYFNKLFLKNYQKDWIDQISGNHTGKFYEVIPSHYRPELIQKKYPNAFYVVINSPISTASKENLKKDIFEKVWQSRHRSLAQRIGYFIQNSNKKPTREQLRKLDNDMSNGEIQCLIHNIKPTENNILKLFEKNIPLVSDVMHYTASHNLFPVAYEDLVLGKKQNIFDWLTKHCNNI